MRNMMMQKFGMMACVTVGAICGMSTAQAQCGASMVAKGAVAWQSLPASALPAPFTAEARITPETRRGDPSIVGLWKITFVSGGQTVDEGFDVWHSDGTELLNDTPPPATGNICVGVWAQTGVLSFRLNHPSWTFDDKGNLNGTAVIREEVALDANGNSFSGTFTVDVLDLNGKNLMHLAGTVTAQRITVD